VNQVSELNPHKYPTDEAIENNLTELFRRVNILQEKYGKPLKVTSGLRSEEQQQGLIAAGKSNAPQSRHLTGEAVDVADLLGDLYIWCKTNEIVLEEAQLWCEERQGGWQHFQSQPPKSGKRWFNP
jgi:hypothetical protein